ncbi:MAG: ATP synthase F0 subunit C [Candidatus Gastranaerophilales bacterium]|jgi:F-type H+-transporting ATPase subunit c|nr:ATP synthase F0 subunit C [Candidatus Gastranaerophilales bacterium]
MDPKSAAILAMGIAVGLAAIGPGIGMGTAVAAAIDATVRQPEAGGEVRTLMFIGLAFMEALAIYALLIALILLVKFVFV